MSTTAALAICPPLQGFTIADLENSIVNKYLPPPAGIDRPHQGVDFAIVDESSNVAFSGADIQIILSGIVSSVIKDRFPYGNAVLIETPLAADVGQQSMLEALPTPWVIEVQDPALTCPIEEEKPVADEFGSIYVLYAHLLEPPTIAIGSEVQCGHTIGRIGMSGNALNPHVHIEARLGPPGRQFESMAHYDSSATTAEMSAYCQWRVSGVFQHFDPMVVLQGLSASGSR